MGTIIKKIRKNTYPILLGILVLAIGIVSFVASQLLFGMFLIVLITSIAIVIYCARLHAWELDNRDEIVTVLAGVVVAFIAMAIAPWIAWAVAFMFLFLFQKYLARIEKRLDGIENGSMRRNSRRRSRNGTGARSRF